MASIKIVNQIGIDSHGFHFTRGTYECKLVDKVPSVCEDGTFPHYDDVEAVVPFRQFYPADTFSGFYGSAYIVFHVFDREETDPDARYDVEYIAVKDEDEEDNDNAENEI